MEDPDGPDKRADTCRFAEIEAGQAQSSSPWAVHMPGGVWPVSLYVFTGAGCNLYMTRSGQQNTLRDKSVCLILRAQEHIVQDALRTAPNQPVDLRNPANADRFRTLAFGESPDAGVTSTFYVGMAPAKGAGAALFDALPDVLQLDFDELPAWLCRATEAIRDELTLRRPGFRSVALRQAELIVIQLIRHYIAAHTPRLPAWISLPEDSRVALALREFHRDISRPWTLDMPGRRHLALAPDRRGAARAGRGHLPLHDPHTHAGSLAAADRHLDGGGQDCLAGGLPVEAAFSIAFKRYSGEPPRRFREGARA